MICFVIVNLSSTDMEDLQTCTVVQLCSLFLKSLQYIKWWMCLKVYVYLFAYFVRQWSLIQASTYECLQLWIITVTYFIIIWHVYFVYWITELRGIDCQSEVGFLALLEHLRYCEVGSLIKNPKHPVWVLGSETHLTGIADWCIHIV
jgi:hypothetical protein